MIGYQAAAGVRIVQGALATQDVDLLRDARRRVKFVSTMAKLDRSVLQVLQQAELSAQGRAGRDCD